MFGLGNRVFGFYFWAITLACLGAPVLRRQSCCGDRGALPVSSSEPASPVSPSHKGLGFGVWR